MSKPFEILRDETVMQRDRKIGELQSDLTTLRADNARMREALELVRRRCCDRESTAYEVEMIATEALKEPK